MILVWRIACDSPNLPNFLSTKLSCYTVVAAAYLKYWLIDAIASI